MARADIVRPVLFDVEVTPKVARGEAIRAVRVILGRSKPNAWSGDRGHWVARYDGAQIGSGDCPEPVLSALLSGDLMGLSDGKNPVTLGLPTQFDGWSRDRM